MLFDLHCHSTASDGKLPARDLVAHAIAAGVDVLAITDHDSVAAYAQLDGVDLGKLELLPGVEISAQWRNLGIHVVGLNVRIDGDGLGDALDSQRQARLERAEIIADKLAKKGFPDLLPRIQALADNDCIGRPHFADQLVALGATRTTDEAFRKYLAADRLGNVQQFWPPLCQTVQWIRNAGGTAVLAHPGKYSLTRSRLGELIDDFKAAGGQAMEVVSGRQDAYKSRDLANLCAQKALLASCGSDFHQPGQSWAELGAQSPLPDNCIPVWDIW